MASLEELVEMEPGTPLILWSEHDWLQVAGFLVKATKRHVTLAMEFSGKKPGKGPMKRYRLNDFERYELLDSQGTAGEPKRNDILRLTSGDVEALGYLGDSSEKHLVLQMASQENLHSITYPGFWRWMRIGCDGPAKEYLCDSIGERSIRKRWAWKEPYNPYARPLGK